MHDILRFDTVSKEQNLVSRRCQARENIILGDNALLANLEDERPEFMCVPSGQTVVIPAAGRWYAFSMRIIRFDIALGRLMDYSVREMPDRRYLLGFHGYLNADVSHVAGLRETVARHALLTADDLILALYDGIYDAVRRAVPKALPQPVPEYGDILAAKQRLEQDVSEALFPLLYRSGLCMRSGFFIEGFARPFFEKGSQ